MTEGLPDSEDGHEPLLSVAFGNQSTTLRVLLLPELVEIFLGFLGRADNARNARVCRIWCDIALKIIWAEVDDPCALFSILAPSNISAKEGGRKSQSFARLPFVSDWHHFDKYARLVRTLKYIATDEEGISRSLLRDVSQTRIRLQIFPNMRALEWNPPCRYRKDAANPSDVILFMHEGVKQFSIFFPEYTKEWQIEQLSLDVPLRMPRLTAIKITTAIDVIKLEKPLSGLFSNLHALGEIEIQSRYLTNRVTEALSSLPALTKLCAGYGKGSGTLFEHSQLTVSAKRFRALQDLMVKAHLDRVTCLLKTMTSTGFHILTVYSQNRPASDIQQLLELCAEKCKGLYYLDMEFKQKLIPNADDPLPLTFASLAALANWSSLMYLNICHQASLSLSLAEITIIVSAHPDLVRLVLNPSPIYCEASALGLDVLPVIARHCKDLEELGLFLNAAEPISPPRLEATSRTVLLPKLTSCSMGVSVISKESCRQTAAYLSKCLPGTCVIEYGAEWALDPTDGDFDDPHVQIAHERSELWREVEGLLQFLEMVRMQERTY